MLTRRNFLSASAAGAVVASTNAVPSLLMQAAAATQSATDGNILVVVQLSGGNDGLNTVIPYADDEYNKNRYSLRIGEDQVRRIDDYAGFHPAMTGMSDLLENEQLAIVQGVGYPNPNRSHFESMDIWHTAYQQRSARPTGWLGRFLDGGHHNEASSSDVAAVHIGSDVQPLALAGLKVHVPSIGSLEDFRLQGVEDESLRRAIDTAITAPRGEATDLRGFLHDASQSALAASRRIQRAAGGYKTSVEYPSSGLSQRLKGVAQLIDANLATRIYYVTLGGFDTHSKQAEAHTALLTELSESLTAFINDLTERGHDKRVLVMCFSEFGRRVKENGSQGTDHGAAAPMFISGGRIKAGLIGKHPSLTDLADGDLKHHTDFRQVYATLLEDWLAANSQGLLGKSYGKLPLIAG